MFEYDNFFKIAVSVDNVIFGFDNDDLKILLIKRGSSPYKDNWALPGDLVYPNEDIDTAAYRILEELTGIKDVFLEQVKAFGTVERHPLGRVITIAYFSLVKISNYEVTPASFAVKAQWHSISTIKNLAFDHDEIAHACVARLKEEAKNHPIGFELLPSKFTLTELQHLYEAILETSLDKRNFRKKILSMNLLVALDESQQGVAHRPAKLYRFDKNKYQALLDQGLSFEFKKVKKR